MTPLLAEERALAMESPPLDELRAIAERLSVLASHPPRGINGKELARMASRLLSAVWFAELEPK